MEYLEFEFLQTVLENVWVQVLLTLLVTVLLHEIIRRLITWVSRKIVSRHNKESKNSHTKRADTISNIISATAGLMIWLVAVAVILDIFNFDLTSIAAGAGLLGIIIGLGAQTMIKDYLAGIAILAENQYRVGDIVTLTGGSTGAGTSGIVEEITLRITKLRGLDGTVNIVRNGEASVITNRTYEFSRVVIDLGVDYDSDFDKVEKVMNEVGQAIAKDPKFERDVKEPIQFLRVDEFGDSAIMVKALGDVEPAKQWEIAGEYRRRLITEFRKNDIVIAFPQVVVHKASE